MGRLCAVSAWLLVSLLVCTAKQVLPHQPKAEQMGSLDPVLVSLPTIHVVELSSSEPGVDGTLLVEASGGGDADALLDSLDSPPAQMLSEMMSQLLGGGVSTPLNQPLIPAQLASLKRSQARRNPIRFAAKGATPATPTPPVVHKAPLQKKPEPPTLFADLLRAPDSLATIEAEELHEFPESSDSVASPQNPSPAAAAAAADSNSALRLNPLSHETDVVCLSSAQATGLCQDVLADVDKLMACLQQNQAKLPACSAQVLSSPVFQCGSDIAQFCPAATTEMAVYNCLGELLPSTPSSVPAPGAPFTTPTSTSNASPDSKSGATTLSLVETDPFSPPPPNFSEDIFLETSSSVQSSSQTQSQQLPLPGFPAALALSARSVPTPMPQHANANANRAGKRVVFLQTKETPVPPPAERPLPASTPSSSFYTSKLSNACVDAMVLALVNLPSEPTAVSVTPLRDMEIKKGTTDQPESEEAPPLNTDDIFELKPSNTKTSAGADEKSLLTANQKKEVPHATVGWVKKFNGWLGTLPVAVLVLGASVVAFLVIMLILFIFHCILECTSRSRKEKAAKKIVDSADDPLVSVEPDSPYYLHYHQTRSATDTSSAFAAAAPGSTRVSNQITASDEDFANFLADGKSPSSKKPALSARDRLLAKDDLIAEDDDEIMGSARTPASDIEQGRLTSSSSSSASSSSSSLKPATAAAATASSAAPTTNQAHRLSTSTDLLFDSDDTPLPSALGGGKTSGSSVGPFEDDLLDDQDMFS